MVHTYQSPVRVYKYPFEMVMAAYEKRFPTCKMIPIFLGCEILEEDESEDGATLTIKRRCKLAVNAPYLVKKIVGVDHLHFIQTNALDRRNRTLKIEAHNESFSSRVEVTENCTYTVHPDNPNWTCFEQDAALDIKHFFGLENTIGKLAMKQYSQNIQKGKEVIEHYIQELINEGITYIPPWIGTNSTPAVAGALQGDQRSEDSGLRSCSSSVASVNSQSSLVLGATAASFQEPAGSGDAVDSLGKLDEDYIARFLGQLTLVEESRLVQLHQWLAKTHKENIPKMPHLLRFLRARDFSVEKARDMLVHSLAWRKLHDIDRLLDVYTTPEVMEKYYAGGWHYHDREGRPLYILRLGQMDVKGLMRSVGEEAILKHVLAKNEEGLKLAAEATKKRENPVSACTCILDLDGLSIRHVWRPGIRALLRIIETVEANYPETMGRLLIVRAPRVFPVLWTLVSPFIDENTRHKFMIYGGKDYLGSGGLVEFVEKQYIPDFLGGDCYCGVGEGGLVPKALYQEEFAECSTDGATPLSTSSLYQTAHVIKEFPHEVLIEVAQKGSVITWDFDILKGDVTFILLRCKRTMAKDSGHQHHVSGAAGGVGCVQYINKNMTVGVDLSIIESPRICHDGDSVQGSHVTSQPGSYILQWRYFDSAKPSFDFPLSTHKSKVMYNTELLPSEAFRGSMSSLQSCQSGFSSLSIGTSQSSLSAIGSCPSS